MLAERTLRVLAELPNQQALLELAAQAPFVLEEAFLQRVEQRMDQASGEGDADLAGRLRARLEGLRLIQSNVQITLPQTLEAFAAVRDAGELLALAQRAPYVLEESFAAAVEHMIAELEQAGSLQDAGALRMRLAALRELAEQRAAADASPLMQALIAFLNAHDSASARAQFVLQRELLDSDDAQILLESAFAGGDAESDQRIAERAQLLRLLRSEQHHDS
jgi:excinuclease UvrABC nuclease subunit